MADLPSGTIWLASYPKSGNTWMRLLFANLIAGGTEAAGINDLARREEIVTSRGAIEEETAIDTTLLRLSEIERLRPAIHARQAARRPGAALVKVHDAFVRLADGMPVLGRAARAVLYLVRDPRDVALSYAHHQDRSPERIVRQMNDPDDTFTELGPQIDYRQLGWSRHVASWLDQDDLPLHLIRYEDLHADTAGTLARALTFLGARFTQDELERAVRHAGFAALQRQEAEGGFRERVSRGAPFFRSGRPGGWRDHLSAELAAEIERANAAVMARLGYDAGLGP